MKRAVLIVLVLEGLALVAMVVASRSEGTDAAGRGLATAYLLAFAAPVVLAAIAYAAGFWRVAGALALILPVTLAVLWFGRASGGRGPDAAIAVSRESDDWFGNPRVSALLAALASPDAAALEPFRGQKALLNALSTDSSRSVLTFAARQFPGSVGTLVELGADPNLTPPHGLHPVISALDDEPMVLRQLLANGANPNAELRAGQPALQQALERSKREHALLLVDGGASIDSVDRLGRTPLYSAVDNHAWTVALRLLEKGADPARAANNGTTVKSLLEQPDWTAWHDDPPFQALVAALRTRGVAVALPAKR